MHYEDILRKIEQENRDGSLIDIYRYNGLIEAIQFFANRLTMEQITDAAYDFVNELLTVEKSAMYLLEAEKYVLKKQRGIQPKPGIEVIPVNQSLKEFALFVGNVISGTESLCQYFDPSLLDALEAKVMLPLLLEEKLYGFFLLSGRVNAAFDEKDIMVCQTLMNLFNKSMENCNRLEMLQISNRELDEKIFNLFAINQSAKAMLTEYSLSNLYKLAVDVFSELTLSAQTGFFLYDNASEKYVLKAYRDVFSSDTIKKGSIKLKKIINTHPGRQIIDLGKDSDRDYFAAVFPDSLEIMEEIKASYVVLIFGDKNKLLGFVTLGKTVSGNPYKSSTFELVESLASYTCIALSNAMLLKKVEEQRNLLQEKLSRLITLNKLSKNINSAPDSNSLLEIALETLKVSFGVEKAFIALYDDSSDLLTIMQSTIDSLNGLNIPMNDTLNPLRKGSMVFESVSENIGTVVGDEIANIIGSSSGILAIPMTMERYETVFVGAIFILKLEEGIISNEENILVFQTIANHIAPLISGIRDLEKQKSLYIPNIPKIFLSALEEEINKCREYDFDLEVIRIKSNDSSPFSENQISRILGEKLKHVYPVSYDRTEIILTNDFEEKLNIIKEALSDKSVDITRFRYKQDFSELQEYINL